MMFNFPSTNEMLQRLSYEDIIAVIVLIRKKAISRHFLKKNWQISVLAQGNGLHFLEQEYLADFLGDNGWQKKIEIQLL